MKKVYLTEGQFHKILEAKKNTKYVLYANTMKCGNSDFMADMEESIEKQDIKKAIKWIPEESIIENGKEVSLDKIEKGNVVLNKDGYIFVRQDGNEHDFFVYKKKDMVNENRRKIFLTESQVKYILSENLQQDLQAAREETNTNPTDAQKEAGNYKMGRINIMGYKIAIENPKGSIRRGKDKNGKEWQIKMNNDYGYFTHTKAIDGDAVDVFIGSKLDSPNIFAIDQRIGGKFDETKVMLGFETAEEAKAAYLSNYKKGWNGFWKITKVNHDTFKKWLYDGYKQRKPFYDYNEIKNKKLK